MEDEHYSVLPPLDVRGHICEVSVDRARARRFADHQRDCYRRYGAEEMSWDPDRSRGDILLLCVETLDGEMVAGSRVHLRSRDAPLPMEASLARWPDTAAALRPLLRSRIAELGGTWQAPLMKRLGANWWLGQASLAVSCWLQTEWTVGWSHERMEPMIHDIGMRRVPGLGPFPFLDHHSSVYACRTPDRSLASAPSRRRIEQLAAALDRGTTDFSLTLPYGPRRHDLPQELPQPVDRPAPYSWPAAAASTAS